MYVLKIQTQTYTHPHIYIYIGIPDPNQTAPTKFETLEHFCEALTSSLINGKTMYLLAYVTKVKEGHVAGQDGGGG